jgi:hypothetical protein
MLTITKMATSWSRIACSNQSSWISEPKVGVQLLPLGSINILGFVAAHHLDCGILCGRANTNQSEDQGCAARATSGLFRQEDAEYAPWATTESDSEAAQGYRVYRLVAWTR